jgi:hypothetical protein
MILGRHHADIGDRIEPLPHGVHLRAGDPVLQVGAFARGLPACLGFYGIPDGPRVRGPPGREEFTVGSRREVGSVGDPKSGWRRLFDARSWRRLTADGRWCSAWWFCAGCQCQSDSAISRSSILSEERDPAIVPERCRQWRRARCPNAGRSGRRQRVAARAHRRANGRDSRPSTSGIRRPEQQPDCEGTRCTGNHPSEVAAGTSTTGEITDQWGVHIRARYG